MVSSCAKPVFSTMIGEPSIAQTSLTFSVLGSKSPKFHPRKLFLTRHGEPEPHCFILSFFPCWIPLFSLTIITFQDTRWPPTTIIRQDFVGMAKQPHSSRQIIQSLLSGTRFVSPKFCLEFDRKELHTERAVKFDLLPASGAIACSGAKGQDNAYRD